MVVTEDGRFSIVKPEHGSAEWHAVRWADEHGKRRLNASTAAALFGQHPYLTQGGLAARMLAPEPPQDDERTGAMERGVFLEPALLAWAAKQLNDEIDTPDFMLGRGRFLATLDGMRRSNGQPVEAKTTTMFALDERGLPDYWRWQGVAQSYVSGHEEIIWVVLDRYMRLRLHHQVVTEEEREKLVAIGTWWLSFIDMGMAPQGVVMTATDVWVRYPLDEVAKVELEADAPRWLRQLKEARAMAKEAKTLEDMAKSHLAVMMGDAGTGTLNGVPVLSWKASSPRHKFNYKAFEKDFPELFVRYYLPTKAYRNMRVLSGGTAAAMHNPEPEEEDEE